MSMRSKVERAGLAAATSLPEPAQRVLAGRPVVLDDQTLATDVQLMLRLQRLSRKPGVEALPIAEGRAALREHTALTSGVHQGVTVCDLRVADLPARLYAPAEATTPGPLLVFFHGGGFFSGDLATHDAPCRHLAGRAGVRVLAIDYRLAPEHPFPAAYDDAVAAYEWVVGHAAQVGAQPARLGVGGDSAGGNLAAGVAIEAAKQGWPCAVQLLVYPTTMADRDTASSRLFDNGFYLTRAFRDQADRMYINGADKRDPRVSPLYADLVHGMAPALVFTAGFDPLRDEGEAYAAKLVEAGVEVRMQRFPDQIHGFFNITGVGRTSRAANQQIADQLRDVLGS